MSNNIVFSLVLTIFNQVSYLIVESIYYRASVYLKSIVKSHSTPFLESTSTKRLNVSLQFYVLSVIMYLCAVSNGFIEVR